MLTISGGGLGKRKWHHAPQWENGEPYLKVPMDRHGADHIHGEGLACVMRDLSMEVLLH